MAHPQPTKNPRIPTNISKYVWLKELEFDFSYPNSPQPNGASPRNCGPVQEGEQGVQMHKSTLLGNEDFHLKKKKHEKLHDFLFHLHVQPGSLGWKKLPENPRVFFSVRFSRDFFQVSNTESNQLLTDGKSFEQMIQSCSLKTNIPNSGDFHAIHTKDTNRLNNDHHQATTRCTGVFSSAKKGANRFRGVVWDVPGIT